MGPICHKTVMFIWILTVRSTECFKNRATWWNSDFASDKAKLRTFRPSLVMTAPTKYTILIALMSGVVWYLCRRPAIIGGGGIGIYSTFPVPIALWTNFNRFPYNFSLKFGCLRSWGTIDDMESINFAWNEDLSMYCFYWVRFQYQFGTDTWYHDIGFNSKIQGTLIAHLEGFYACQKL
jgi:hypothetical protein